MSAPNAAQKNITKAYSAHGNAVGNGGGFDASTGVDGAIPNTRAGVGADKNIACFDCHNSHGSSASGTTTSYSSATTNGGILKDTIATKGGYLVTYTPASGGSSATHNGYNPGAGLCFDCHLNADSGTSLPWGYQSTYGATQAIMSYWDTAYFGAGSFGSQQRYPYKAATGNMGGHFGRSSDLSSPPDSSHQINGLCTPCHDPHGVSPSLGANAQYAVPLLKGTFLTSPYKEDAAPADNVSRTYQNGASVYHIDQNTFGSDISNTPPNNIIESDTVFAGLCLNCHSKGSLTDGTTHTWKDKNRVHESVKGWKTANATIQHNYVCSKCHTPHNSRLPRLMATNCLNSGHKGRSYNASPVVSGSDSGVDLYINQGGPNQDYPGDRGGSGSGSGHIPGSYGGHVVACHETDNNHNNSDTDQSWNVKTPWLVPVLTSPTADSIGSSTATLGANVTNDSGAAITARGTVWGTSRDPHRQCSCRRRDNNGVFTHARTGLPVGTKIYYRGYATNSVGTGYSPDGSFYTEPSTQASGVNFTSVGSASMTVNWTRGKAMGLSCL